MRHHDLRPIGFSAQFHVARNASGERAQHDDNEHAVHGPAWRVRMKFMRGMCCGCSMRIVIIFMRIMIIVIFFARHVEHRTRAHAEPYAERVVGRHGGGDQANPTKPHKAVVLAAECLHQNDVF